jgi:hypothetical protein
MAVVHYKQCAGSPAHVQQFYSYFCVPHKQFFISCCCPSCLVVHPAGHFPIGHMCYLKLAMRSHHSGTLAPPHNGGAYILFSRPFQEPHRPFFHLYWSRSCCCLRSKKGLNISATLVNFRGRQIASVLSSLPTGPSCKSRSIAVLIPDDVVRACPESNDAHPSRYSGPSSIVLWCTSLRLVSTSF